MSIPNSSTKNQVKKLDKYEKIQINRAERKLRKNINKHIHTEAYDNDTVTKFGNFSKLLAFKEFIGIESILNEIISEYKHYTCKFLVAAIVNMLIDYNMLGVHRFSHMDQFLNDEGFKKICGNKDVPTERTLRETLYKVDEKIITQLETVNNQILERKSLYEGPRKIWIDIDSTTISIFGKQEGGEKGYNSKYKGRPCMQAKVAFVAGTNELIRIELHDGKSASNTDHLKFMEKLEKGLPENWYIEGVRTDRGYFAEDNFEYYEDREWDYVCKVKKGASVKDIIEYLNQDLNNWQKEDKIYSHTEIRMPLKTWEHARRFVIIKENISERKLKEDGQLYMEDAANYEYSVIVTSFDDMEPMDVWRFYNKRGNCENKIDELKSGFATAQNSQNKFKCNKAYCMIKAIAYNIVNWFREALLPGQFEKCEIKTIRRRIICAPANILGTGRFMKIRFQADGFLEVINKIITDNLLKLIKNAPPEYLLRK